MTISHPAAARAASVVADGKGDLSVSLCIPARDEEATIGRIVEQVRRELVDRVPLVDQVVVADDGSVDATAARARAAGADVVTVAHASPALDPRSGKGEAMWKALAASTGDLVVWIDADLDPFDPLWPARLVAPLVFDPSVTLVKGYYQRPVDRSGQGGGRVSELVARPIISLYHPDLAGIAQPLGGEYAARRSTLVDVPFAGGYGVDLGLLIDVAHRDGRAAIAQVDLGVRHHRHRPLGELGVQAAEVLHVALRRAGAATTADPVLWTAAGIAIGYETRDRPPLTSVREPVHDGFPPFR